MSNLPKDAVTILVQDSCSHYCSGLLASLPASALQPLNSFCIQQPERSSYM